MRSVEERPNAAGFEVPAVGAPKHILGNMGRVKQIVTNILPELRADR